ncbi:MAG TPA: alpha/beta hydrolase [Edaphocola sp.]|nr:alpha/beta hydrolase [Edaphocola sp.]
MKQHFLGFSLLFLALSFSANAQSITGDWQGVLNVAGTELPLVFHIKDSDNILDATMDSPDQNVMNIPVSAITFDDPKLHLEAGNGAIVYEGVLTGDSITGTFRQNGMTLPLNLHKGGIKKNIPVRPQEPKPPFPYKSEDLSFMNKKAGITLSGTLTIPDEGSHFPAVILISGSGPQDRDETLFGHRPFWVIADYLSRNGIAVLRFDDRGTAKSGGNFTTATTADFATDVAAAVEYLKRRKEINAGKIGLAGHSEGGIIAPMVAASNKNIAFIILLAAPGVDGAALLVMQNDALGKAEGLSPEQLAMAKATNEALYKIAINTGNDSLAQRLIREKLSAAMPADVPEARRQQAAEAQAQALTGPWMRYFLANDPAKYLKEVHCPVLALDGTKDLQVPAEKNIEAIKAALGAAGNKRVTTRIFPGLNHLFQEAGTGLPNEYGKIEETFSPQALQFMANWIKKQEQ